MSNMREQKIDIYIPLTGTLEKTIQPTSVEEVREKIHLANLAQAGWAKLSIKERAKYVRQVVNVLRDKSFFYAEKISRYNGKLPEEALVAEVFPTLNSFDYYATPKIYKSLKPKCVFVRNMPLSKAQIEYAPVGIAASIAPWNYPFKLALQDTAPALMAGNAVVIKMSEHASGIGFVIKELMKESGIPKNLVTCLYGYGDVGQQLLEEELVQKVTFIGSIPTGQKVARLAGEKLIPCTLELGGKDPAIVLEDCDIEKTVRGVVWGAFTNCGQTCASVELLYVPKSIKEPFLTSMKKYFDSIPIENFGSMNVLFQGNIVKKQLEEALDHGGKIFASKNVESTTPGNPFRLNPQLLVDVPEDCKLIKDETFGPILPITFYDDLDQVIKKVNNSPYGLTASIWTKDYARGTELARRIDTGVVTINDHMITPGIPEAPWTGHKKSGMGYSSSSTALINNSKIKFVYHDRGFIKYKFWQYPYSKEKSVWTVKFFQGTFANTCIERLWSLAVNFPKILFGE